MAENPVIPVNRNCVLVIQGGGIFGLTLLGQAQAIIEDQGYRPLALAGSSAGAIVATLLWAGLTPSTIARRIENVAAENGPQGLAALLGPFEVDPLARASPIAQDANFDFPALVELSQDAQRFAQVASDADGSPDPLAVRLWVGWRRFKRIYPRAARFFAQRGIFSGRALEGLVERLLRESPLVTDEMRALKRPLTFRDFAPERTGRYHPPLVLTTTNLSRRRLELITSFESKYERVSIAAAARASAGFPIFFRPRTIAETPRGGTYVDGGLVSNFPSWVFNEAFLSARQPHYRFLESTPYIRIGLRVVGDSEAFDPLTTPASYYDALVAMLTGGARNELERRLASTYRRTLTVHQFDSTTGGPASVLDFGKLEPKLVRTMIRRGREVANDEVVRRRKPQIYASGCAEDVQEQLDELIRLAVTILGQPDNSTLDLRAMVYLPHEEPGGELALRVAVHANMDGDPDLDLALTRDAGLTGLCRRERRPFLCNLQEVSLRRAQNPERWGGAFGMSDAQQRAVDSVTPPRTWLAAMPILDPYATRPSPDDAPMHRAPYEAFAFYPGKRPLQGAVLGVLDMDGALDYAALRLEPNPYKHATDARIAAIMQVMRSTALDLGDLLAERYTGETDDADRTNDP